VYYVWVKARTVNAEGGFGESVQGTTASSLRPQVISITLFPSADNILPQSVTVSRTGSVTLSVTGNNLSSFQWYVDGEQAGTNASLFNFTGTGKRSGAVYEAAVVATSSNGTNYFGRCRVTITQ
jgi:hypothetical protein